MHKNGYYYNPITCSYENIKTPVSAIILRSVVLLVVAVMLAIGIIRYYSDFFVSAREVELLEDNERLKTYYRIVQQKIEDSTALLANLQEQDDNIYRLLLNAEPRSGAERNAGMGGIDRYAQLGKETLIAQTLSKVDQLASQLNIQKKSYNKILNLAEKHVSKLRSMPSLPPVSKKHLKRVSGSFGMRFHPIYKIRMFHKGVDFAAPIHTPIYATADGNVQWVKNENKGYGSHLLIEHGNGFQTLYGHMHSITVKKSQKVKRGQQIGTVGNSGDSTAPHLHYEVYCSKTRVDPLQYFVGELTPAEYDKVCKQAVCQTQTLCTNFQ